MANPFKNKEFVRTVKFVLFSISAGAIQLLVTGGLTLIWPESVFSLGPVLFYSIGLLASVVWNLTFNRKFTFKSAANLSVAILETIGFYLIFAPASAFFQGFLTNGEIFNLLVIKHINLPSMVGTLICMVINLGLEFPFQRFVVFRNSIDTNTTAQETTEETK